MNANTTALDGQKVRKLRNFPFGLMIDLTPQMQLCVRSFKADQLFTLNQVLYFRLSRLIYREFYPRKFLEQFVHIAETNIKNSDHDALSRSLFVLVLTF